MRCAKRWCWRRASPWQLFGRNCRKHGWSPGRRAVMEELARQVTPIKVDPSKRPKR